MGQTSPPNRTNILRAVTISGGFLVVMLAVEFLDEFVFGANEAA